MSTEFPGLLKIYSYYHINRILFKNNVNIVKIYKIPGNLKKIKHN